MLGTFPVTTEQMLWRVLLKGEDMGIGDQYFYASYFDEFKNGKTIQHRNRGATYRQWLIGQCVPATFNSVATAHILAKLLNPEYDPDSFEVMMLDVPEAAIAMADTIIDELNAESK